MGRKEGNEGGLGLPRTPVLGGAWSGGVQPSSPGANPGVKCSFLEKLRKVSRRQRPYWRNGLLPSRAGRGMGWSYLGVYMAVGLNPRGLQMIMLSENARKVEERSLLPDLLLLCSCLNERALCLELLGRIAVRLTLRIYIFFFVLCWNISPNDVLKSFTILAISFSKRDFDWSIGVTSDRLPSRIGRSASWRCQSRLPFN